MPYVLRKFNCDTCGEYTERKLASADRRRCQHCGIKAMVASTVDMATGTGPSWEAWRNSPGARGRPRKQPREE